MVSPQEKIGNVETSREKERKVREMAMKVVERFGVVDAIGNPVEPANLDTGVIELLGLKGAPLVVMVCPKDNKPFFNKTTIRRDIVPGDSDTEIRLITVPSSEGKYGIEIKYLPERVAVGGPGATWGKATGNKIWEVELVYPITYPHDYNISFPGEPVNLTLADYPNENDSMAIRGFAFGITKDGRVAEEKGQGFLALDAPRTLVLMSGHLGLNLDERWAKAAGVPYFFVGQSTEGKTETVLSAEGGEQ